MPSISVGLVGYGVAGAVFHAPLIQATAGLELAAIVTSRAMPLAGVRVVPAVDSLLADNGIAVVIIASPTPTHYDLARAALLAGKHVVVDKPLALTAAEADDLIALAARQNRLLTVFQNRRWDGDFQTVRQVIGSGALGDIYHYEAHYDRFRPQRREVWRELGGPGSGILYDLGAHLVDQSLQLFGMPSAVTADVLEQRDGSLAVDYFHLVLDYGRARAILHASMVVPHAGPHFTVHGTGGTLVKSGMDPQEDALRAGQRPGNPGWGADDAANYALLFSAKQTQTVLPTLPGAYEQFYAQLAAAVAGNGPLPVDPRDSRDGLVVIEAALRSAAERRTVEPG